MAYKPRLQQETDEFIIPPIEGTSWSNWQGLVRYDQFSRYSIDDTAADDLQNWMPMGSNMRQTPGNGANIAALPGGTAIFMQMQVLNAGVFFFALSTNGHLYQISLGGVVTDVSGATSLSSNTVIANWQGTTIIISDPNVSKIYSWNGTTFATVFSAQQASFLAVYQGHLWLGQGSTLTWTDTNTFNSLGGVGGSLSITDSDCLTGIVALFPFNGLLYIFGPSFIQVLGNLYVTGSPAVLQFTKYTITANIGTVSQYSINAYGPNLYFANKFGIWMLQGSTILKTSQPLDGFFQNLDATSSFSCGFAVVYNIPCVFWNVLYNGDSPATYRTFGYTNVGQWFSVVAGTVKFISGFVSAGVPNLYGTDGTNVFQMLTNTSANVTSVYNGKYWLFNSPIGYDQIKFVALFMVTGAACTLNLTYVDDDGNTLFTLTQKSSSAITWLQDGGAPGSTPVTWQNNSLTTVSWLSSSAIQQNVFQFDGPGRLRSFAINTSTVGTGIYLQSLSVGFKHSEAGWGV